MSRQPPPLATALLTRLSTNDALAGDLREAYAEEKSRWWYWRQVFAGIVVEAWRDSYASKWRSIGTVMGGLMLVSMADGL